MAEVIDRPDTATKDIVAKAIKNAQDFARQNAEEPDKWSVDWVLYCGPIPLQTRTTKAKKVGENEWVGTEPVVFGKDSACQIRVFPHWVKNGSQKIDLRKVLGQGHCVANLVISDWSLTVVGNEATVWVQADGDIQG